MSESAKAGLAALRARYPWAMFWRGETSGRYWAVWQVSANEWRMRDAGSVEELAVLVLPPAARVGPGWGGDWTVQG